MSYRLIWSICRPVDDVVDRRHRALGDERAVARERPAGD
jgi:hypothetical protein